MVLPMANPPVCICSERLMKGQTWRTKAPKTFGGLEKCQQLWMSRPIEYRKWTLVGYKCSPGGKSRVHCHRCGKEWLTRAKYVEVLLKRDSTPKRRGPKKVDIDRGYEAG